MAFSDSYKQTMLPFSKIISNNINISREIFTLFLSSNETRLAFSEIYYKQHNTTQFFTSSYQTILQLSGGYYQTILHTCFQSPYQIIDTFRELLQNNTTYFLPEFISNNNDTFRAILSNKVHFLSELT